MTRIMESMILLLTAASVAFAHTILGPDHYLVFAAMGKARGWSLARTLRITFYCGLGHVLSSFVIGMIGLLLGAQLGRLVTIEGLRGNLAGWALIAFGLMYMSWGMRNAGRSITHAHRHEHDGVVHTHVHDHHADHMHVHQQTSRNPITPWALFIIFVLGPCEVLIPLVMYPAAQQSAMLVMSVAVLFGIVTLATMLAAVTVTMVGIEKLKFASSGRYAHAVAGLSIAVCGFVVSFLL